MFFRMEFVISSYPPLACEIYNFGTLLKALSDEGWKRYLHLSPWKLIGFNCDFSSKVTYGFLMQK